MNERLSFEEQIAMAGITYRRRHDILYRAGMVMQALGLGILAVLYPLQHPFYTVGIMLFEAGILLSAVYLLVWISWIKNIILGSAIFGIVLQIAAYNFAPEQYAGNIIIAGIGFVCVGAAGLAGREAYCFAWREGWVLMWSYPVVVFANLLWRESRVFNSLAFSALFLLDLFITGRKLRQPVLTSYTPNVCCDTEQK